MSSDSLRSSPAHDPSPASSPLEGPWEGGGQTRRDAWVQKLLGEPGVWYMRQESLAAEGDAAAPSTVIRPIYLRRLDPSAPLPEDVAPTATRYDVFFERAPRTPWQLAVTWLGILSMLAGAVAMTQGFGEGLLGLLGGAVAAVAGSHREDELRFEPCQNGRWIEAPGEMVPAEPTPPEPTWAIHASKLVCVLAVAVLISDWGSLTWFQRLTMLGAGMIFGQVGFHRFLPFRQEDPAERLRAQVRFYELADPARPLAPDAAPPLNAGGAGRALPNAAPAAQSEATEN